MAGNNKTGPSGWFNSAQYGGDWEPESGPSGWFDSTQYGVECEPESGPQLSLTSESLPPYTRLQRASLVWHIYITYQLTLWSQHYSEGSFSTVPPWEETSLEYTRPKKKQKNKRKREQIVQIVPGPSSEFMAPLSPIEITPPPESPVQTRRPAAETPAPPNSPVEMRPPAPKRVRRPIPHDWEPPLAVGASLGENLSRLEEADRTVLQWEAILENARKTQPRADLSSFERQVEKVKRERDELEEIEENLIPVEDLESTKRERIENRLDVLKDARRGTQSSLGLANIDAAIRAYKEGRIDYWNKWTLFYAGHIVDYCPTYASFTENREARLDLYYKLHGDGWLWFEPPLAPNSSAPSNHLLAATWAQPTGDESEVWAGVRGWEITMGFRRVKAFHSRFREGEKKASIGEHPAELMTPENEHGEMKQAESKHDKNKPYAGNLKLLTYRAKLAAPPSAQNNRLSAVKDEPDGPRCFFKMQLDSGATSPCLYNEDLLVLGIDKDYPAQTWVPMACATETVNSPLYEARVDVCKHNGESLVGERPVWPAERHEIGGIYPVVVIPGATKPRKGVSAPLSMEELERRKKKGEDVSEEAMARRPKSVKETRLSGMLPFQVCYSASAPGMHIWFGEDRCDVLGTDKMPGQRRWERHRAPRWQRVPLVDDLKDKPKTIAFEHEIRPGKRLIDTDVKGHTGASIVKIIDGTEMTEYRLEPRRLAAQRTTKKTRNEVKADKAKKFLEAFGQVVAKKQQPFKVLM